VVINAKCLPQLISKNVKVSTQLNSSFQRYNSTQQPADLFNIDESNKDQGYAILKLNKAPVNSLNLEFLTALNIQLDKFEQSKNFEGVILTSDLNNIFSAGLDIMEMYQGKPERLRHFWWALQEFWIKLYGSSMIYIACINGHAPAGGCLMAMSCDYRIMADGPYKIGLNETLLVILFQHFYCYLNLIIYKYEK
jgi:Delta3-Delta2-enoyl-CoA isomerase